VTAPLPAVIAGALAIAVMAGAVAAVSAREARVGILGLLVALAGSPFLADPLPDARGIVARIASAALVAYLLLMAVRGRPDAPGPRVAGWPLATLVAVTAAVTVLAASGGPDLAGLVMPATAGLFLPAAAAGAAVLAVAAAPVVLATEPLRLSVGLLLAAVGTSLVAASISGPASPLADLCLAGLLGTLAGGGTLLHHVSRRPAAQPGHR